MRRSPLLVLALLSLAGLATGERSLFAQHRSYDSHIPGTNGLYKQNWGVSIGSPRSGIGGSATFGTPVPGYAYRSGYSSFGFPGFGYSRFGYSGYGYGGFGYYSGPVGGYPTPYGPLPYGYASYGYPNYGPNYTYIPPAPVVIQPHPIWLGQNPFDNDAIREWMPQPQGAGNIPNQVPGVPNQAPAVQPPQENPQVIIKPSNVESRRTAIRLQAQGDEWFQKHNFIQAYARYKQAAAATPDLAEPRLRMAIALAAMSEFSQAATEMKRAMRIDPSIPFTADRLDALYGDGGGIAKNSLLHKLQEWVREDIRDPDRLFVIGAILYLDDDVDRATPFLQAAAKLAGSPFHIQAFLRPVAQAGTQGAPQRVVPAAKPPAPAIDNVAAPTSILPKQKSNPPAAPLDGPQLILPAEPNGPSSE